MVVKIQNREIDREPALRIDPYNQVLVQGYVKNTKKLASAKPEQLEIVLAKQKKVEGQPGLIDDITNWLLGDLEFCIEIRLPVHELHNCADAKLPLCHNNPEYEPIVRAAVIQTLSDYEAYMRQTSRNLTRK